MRKLCLSIFGICSLAMANAQFNIAIVGGPHGASTTPDFVLKQDSSSLTQTKRGALHFGVMASAPIYNNLFFQTGVIYSAKGSTVVQTFDTSTKAFYNYTTKLQVNYIDVPLNILYKLPLKGKTKFVLSAGPQASLFYNGSTLFSSLDKGGNYKETVNEDLPVGKKDAQFRVLHWAYNINGGLDFGKAFLVANYTSGLTPFYTTATESYKHKTIGATLGIYLGKQQPVTPKVKDKDKDGVPDNEDECPNEAGSLLTKGCPDKDGDGIADKNDQCPEIAGIAAFNGCPVTDKDNDGINDKDDKCPDVAGVTKYYGCPIPDTDRDGINDVEDSCINIAGVAKYHGCPVPDSDGDGINDEEDKCPTIAGSSANNGCPQVDKEIIEKVTYAARQIQFELGKAQLTNASLPVLDDVAEILLKNESLKIVVEGHTSGANNATNLKLSQLRADRVKAYFISKGIAETRIKAVGYGSTMPINNGKSAAEQAKNRRVELKLNAE